MQVKTNGMPKQIKAMLYVNENMHLVNYFITIVYFTRM